MSSDTARIDVPPRRTSSRARIGASSTASIWQFTALVWVVHWLLTQVPATLAYRFGSIRTVRESPPRSGVYVLDWGPDSRAYSASLPDLEALPKFWSLIAEPFRNWDGTWYMVVADRGHSPELGATAAFWPLYPWLMRLGSNITGMAPEIIGYVISNVAFFFAIYFLYRLVCLDFSVSVAEKTVWAVALFPTAFFFTAVYTESLFFLLAVAALYFARRGEWLLAGVIGLLAALTRSAGMMLLAPFFVLFLQQYGWKDPRRWFPQGFAAVLPILGPAIFGWHLHRQGMEPLDWADQQWQWNRFSATPWRTLDCTVNGCEAEVRSFGNTRPDYVYPIDWGWIGAMFDNLSWSYITSSEFRFRVGESHVLELLVTLLAFILVLIGLKLVPFWYTAFVVPPILVPLFSPSSVNPLMSMPRFVLPLFPLFVVVAILIAKRSTLSWVLAGVSSVLLVLLSMQFALWYWVS
jgi:hypothetical protein